MSYVRIIRLPPQSDALGAVRCWRRHLSARKGATYVHAQGLLLLLEQNHCFSLKPVSTHRNFGSATVQGLSNDCFCEIRDVAAGDLVGDIVGNTARKYTIGAAFSNWESPISNALALDGPLSIIDINRRGSGAVLLRSTKARASFLSRGALGTASGPDAGGSWSKRHVYSQSFRAFASEKSDSKADAPVDLSGRKVQSDQRAFLGGLLKPSDKEIEPVKDESAQRFKDLQEEYTLYEAARKDPRQTSEQVEQSQMAITRKKAVAMVKKLPVMTWDTTKSLVMFLWNVMKNPHLLKEKLAEAQYHLKEFGRHYWLGLKLLWGDIKTAKKIIKRILRGFPMTRRERKQLLRTASDIFRMVPLAAFVLIPFMEFLLPVALRIFPNMLPSTFQDNLKEEEKLKKELRLRMAYAGFLQETVTAMAVKKKTRAEDGGGSEATTAELTEFIEKAKMGEITNQDIPKFAKMFKDELTMDNISRSGLVNMCRYMGLPPFGNDNFLRFQLRSKLRAITQPPIANLTVQDDQRILWEGVSSLTKQELQEACRERGMRATGLTKQGYVRQLSQWLDLSTKKSVPISLLIMSRAFTLQAPDPARALAQSISAMDEDVVTEVMIEAASSEEQKTPEYRTRKLESLERQNELIEEENIKREEAKQAQEAKKAEGSKKAAELKEAEGVESNDAPSKADNTAETFEDEAVNKAIEKAAMEAMDRTTQRDSSPQVTMREGQKQFKATSNAGAKGAKEEVTTEADTVTGGAAGDRLVKALPKKTKKEAVAKKAKAKLEKHAEKLTDIGEQFPKSDQMEDVAEDGASKLTVADLDALESLASPSSVEKEKAQLAMMKAALQESLGQPGNERINGDASDAADAENTSTLPGEEIATLVPATGEETVKHTKPAVEAQRTPDAKESIPAEMAVEATPDGETSELDGTEGVEEVKPEEPAVDKSVQRVQTKLASMLNRIELEIQSVEKRIGDKMHVLDRDKDGMVSAEEIAYVVQHVLSTTITEEEAKAIAKAMDADSDGEISVAELIAWVKKNSEQDPEDVFNELYKRNTEEGPTKTSPKAKK